MDDILPKIDRIWIFTLYGERAEKFDTPQEALDYLQGAPDEKSGHLVRIEVQIRLTSGEMVEGTFNTKPRAISFIEGRHF